MKKSDTHFLHKVNFYCKTILKAGMFFLYPVFSVAQNNNNFANKNINSVWDVLFSWNLPSQYRYEAGAETDGTYIYTARYNSTSSTPQFYKYTLSGTLADSFQISGVTAIRDLAYDGTYFYGGSNGVAIYQMDFTNHSLVQTITCPTGTTVRSIAYDPANDAFWAGGWDTGNRDLKLVSRSGQIIQTIPAASYGLTSVYGTAYDGWTVGGPYLWAFDQGQSGEEVKLYQINIATGQQTGVSHDCSLDVASGIASPLAGGLFCYHNSATGTTTLGGCVQMVRVFGYNLATCVNPVNDVGIIAVTNPITNCGLSESEPITVKVKNFGSSPVSNFKIAYELAIFQKDTETITQTIQPGDTLDFTFTRQGDFTNLGGYWLTVFTMLTGDESHVNDTIIDYIYHLTPEDIPYSMGFETTESFTGWTILDHNNDGKTWSYFNYEGHTGSSSAIYEYSLTNQADDWLISNCIDLIQGQSYKAEFYYRAASTNYHESLALYMGNYPSPTSLTTLLIDLPSFNNTAYAPSSAIFSVPVSGSYYFGWHAYSQANMWKISLDDVNISNVTTADNLTEDIQNLYICQEQDYILLKSSSGISSVKIMNAIGKVVYINNFDNNPTEVNIKSLPPGMYVVSVETAKNMLVKKIIIH